MTPSFLWDTPPRCPTPECFMHRDEEHHVEGCPMYDTMFSASHRVSDEVHLALEALEAELRRSWVGRVALVYAATWADWKARARRLRQRLGR